MCREVGCRDLADVWRVGASEVHSALEVFVMGIGRDAIVPVGEVDGRTVGEGTDEPVTARFREVYRGLLFREEWSEVLAAPRGGVTQTAARAIAEAFTS
mmetsp:Transcript_36293/g.71411  ORF Transcript_36293/g.71411 Transcript_36293/m.71411 type:complete len:99 (+) Transcript_36293:646-942(+)